MSFTAVNWSSKEMLSKPAAFISRCSFCVRVGWSGLVLRSEKYTLDCFSYTSSQQKRRVRIIAKGNLGKFYHIKLTPAMALIY